MQDRTFCWEQPTEAPKIFQRSQNQNKPTRHQTKSDKAARAKNRLEARRLLLSTGFESDALAVEMAVGGFGVDAIHNRTGIPRSVISKLVLGE